MLIACSNAPQSRIEVSIEQTAAIKPKRPDPITIKTEKWVRRENLMCMTPAAARRTIAAKVSTGEWMAQMNRLVDYYEDLVTPRDKSVKK